jgi:hypothetical protein
MDLFNDLKTLVRQRLNELGVSYTANADADTLQLLVLTPSISKSRKTSLVAKQPHDSAEFA